MKQLPVPATDRWGNACHDEPPRDRVLCRRPSDGLHPVQPAERVRAGADLRVDGDRAVGGEPLHLGLRDVRDRADDRLCRVHGTWRPTGPFGMIRVLGANRQERQAMRHDETFRPLVGGEGRISGYLSIAFGGLSVLGVLCFLFPDALTTPSLRAGYDIGWMRVLLGAGMVFSAAFGLLTFVLNRQKRLGAIGIALTILAMYMGGATVQVGPRYGTPGYLGLDWFILDLLMSAFVFIFLEKIVPLIREQAILRPDFWHDARYFIFNHLAISIFLF